MQTQKNPCSLPTHIENHKINELCFLPILSPHYLLHPLPLHFSFPLLPSPPLSHFLYFSHRILFSLLIFTVAPLSAFLSIYSSCLSTVARFSIFPLLSTVSSTYLSPSPSSHDSILFPPYFSPSFLSPLFPPSLLHPPIILRRRRPLSRLPLFFRLYPPTIFLASSPQPIFTISSIFSLPTLPFLWSTFLSFLSLHTSITISYVCIFLFHSPVFLSSPLCFSLFCTSSVRICSHPVVNSKQQM